MSGADGIELGLRVLESILDRGLVLTPERVRPNDPDYGVMTKRVCFTLLSPSALEGHTKLYGPISLEWEPATLRTMGALPVIYFPFSGAQPQGELAETLFASLAHTTTLLERLSALFEMARNDRSSTAMVLERNGLRSEIQMSAKGAADLADAFEADSLSVQNQLNALRCLSSLIQQTDDPAREDALGNYRLREWRIVANVLRHGVPVTEAPDESDIEALLGLNNAYFGRVERFRTGEHQIVRQCQIYRTVNGLPLHNTVKRIIAPAEAHQQIQTLLCARGATIPVSDLAQLK